MKELKEILWFKIFDNFSEKLHNIQRERNKENKQISLWIKDKAKRNGYQYFLPIDFLERNDKEDLLIDMIDSWDDNHNKDIYGNRSHIFTSSKVAIEAIEKYRDFLNQPNLKNPENQNIKHILKDGSIVEASEEMQNLYKLVINSFITDNHEDEEECNV
jgi:hypothetical protein